MPTEMKHVIHFYGPCWQVKRGGFLLCKTEGMMEVIEQREHTYCHGRVSASW